MGKIYHVNQEIGQDWFAGTEEQPFRTISRAAKAAMYGDTSDSRLAGTYRGELEQRLDYFCMICDEYLKTDL